MATQKPISTISYNSEAFLKEKLDTWVSSHIIQAYMYVGHVGEDGDKGHFHVRVEPNKKLDPMDLSEQLKEWVPGSDKPLGVRPWRNSKEEDWILYAVHDPEYLQLKYGGGEKGEKLPYKWQDIKASEYYDIETAFIRAKAYLAHSSVNIASRIQQGESGYNLLMEGENVFTINAITQALSKNDYQRLVNAYNELENRFFQLSSAIENLGYTIVVNNDNVLTLEQVSVYEHAEKLDDNFEF